MSKTSNWLRITLIELKTKRNFVVKSQLHHAWGSNWGLPPPDPFVDLWAPAPTWNKKHEQIIIQI